GQGGCGRTRWKASFRWFPRGTHPSGTGAPEGRIPIPRQGFPSYPTSSLGSAAGSFPAELPLRRFPVYNLLVMENNNSRHERLLELVRERVRHSGRSHRELERELDLGHGTLG